MTRLLACLFVLPLLVGSLPAAQSLADVARKEGQRRQTVRKPSPVYTNKDLQPVRGGDAAPAAAAPGEETPQPEAAAGGQEDEEGAQAGEGQQRPVTEEDWRTRITDARTELERARMFAEALQSRINALWADFTARDDPGQRAAIETERGRALAELGRVKNEIEARTKAITDLEEEARRANVPPGWLR